MKLIIAILVTFVTAIQAQANLVIEEVTSPGGIKAWFVQEPSIPMVSIQIGFRGASTIEADDKLGSTYLMTGLLEEGAGELSATEWKTEVESLAASFSFDSSRERITISGQFLKETQSEAIALLKAAINEPRFDDVAFERTKAQVASIVARRATDPNDIASDAFRKVAYGSHPYARPFEGRTETIASLTQEDMREIHKKALTRDRVFVGVVGDISKEELGIMLDQLLLELPEKGPELPNYIEFQADGGLTLVDFDTPQSVAIWGHQGISQSDPDFFPAFVMNHVLGGGGFSSRLTDEVREKRGLTYGVYSYLAGNDNSDYFGGSVSSSNDRISQAIDVIKTEWSRMAEGGVTQEELIAAKKNMTGSYALRFDGNSQIANILLFSQMDDFPIDYPLKRNGYIDAVTKEDIARVAKRLLREDDMHFVVVGKPDGLESSE